MNFFFLFILILSSFHTRAQDLPVYRKAVVDGVKNQKLKPSAKTILHICGRFFSHIDFKAAKKNDLLESIFQNHSPKLSQNTLEEIINDIQYLFLLGEENFSTKETADDFLQKLTKVSETINKKVQDKMIEPRDEETLKIYFLMKNFLSLVDYEPKLSGQTSSIFKKILSDLKKNSRFRLIPSVPFEPMKSNVIDFSNTSLLQAKNEDAEFYSFITRIKELLHELTPDGTGLDKILRTLDKTQEIVFYKTGNDYKKGDVVSANSGLINYMRDEILYKDPSFLDLSQIFYEEIRRLDIEFKTLSVGDMKGNQKNPIYLFDDPIEGLPDLWKVALKTTKDFYGQEDPYRALRLIALFGHDDIEQFIPTSPIYDFEFRLKLNQLQNYIPHEQSVLYHPESIKGLSLSSETMRLVSVVQKEEEKLNRSAQQLRSELYNEITNKNLTSPDLEFYQTRLRAYKEDSYDTTFDSAYRLGQYHFYGGMFLATELIKSGYDKVWSIKLPIYIAESMAYFYKTHTMLTRYLDHHALQAYNSGITKFISYEEFSQLNLIKKIKNEIKDSLDKSSRNFEVDQMIAEVDAEVFIMKTYTNLMTNLLILKVTPEQHRKGAEFAYKILTEKKK